MANLFLSTSYHYYTTSSSPVVTYRFPLPLFLEYMLVYPLCRSDHWTSYYARIYHNNSEVAGTDGWVNPTNCLQGQPSKLVVRLHVDKVGLLTIKDWGVRSIPDSLSFAKLVMMPFAPAKSAGEARYASQDPFILAINVRCPIISSQICIRSAFFLRRT